MYLWLILTSAVNWLLAVVRETPPNSDPARYLTRIPRATLASNNRDSGALVTSHYGDWSSSRTVNMNDRRDVPVRGVDAFGRPGNDFAVSVSRSRDEGSRVHAVARQPGTASYCQHRTATTVHPVTHARPMSSCNVGTQHSVARTQLPRSQTVETHLSSSSSGRVGYAHSRPLPSDPAPTQSYSRRSLPYTAYRM